MTPQELRDRADKFSVDIIALCKILLDDPRAKRIAWQLQDAATSVAANYHAVCRARSRAEFVSKLCITVEEADESLLWLTTLKTSQLASGKELDRLQDEALQLTKIFAASRKTASRRRTGGDTPKSPNQ